jgi:hypothetical protein
VFDLTQKEPLNPSALSFGRGVDHRPALQRNRPIGAGSRVRWGVVRPRLPVPQDIWGAPHRGRLNRSWTAAVRRPRARTSEARPAEPPTDPDPPENKKPGPHLLGRTFLRVVLNPEVEPLEPMKL